MQLSRRVALGGVQLDAANSAIVIRGVETADGKESITAVGTAAGFGQRVTGARRDTMDIVVRFAIDIRKTNLSGRAAALEDANAWAARAAGGAWMTVNYRSGRRIFVRLVQAPGEGNIRDWVKEFQMTFRAYEIPYWEDAEESTKSAESGTSGLEAFTIGGSAPAQIDITVENTGEGTINEISIAAGGKSMAFADLGLLAGETLYIDHTDSGLVRIRIKDSNNTYRSAMAKRASTADDDYLAQPGTTSFSYLADGSCTVTAGWRARYL